MAVAPPALAATIYGSLTRDGQPLGGADIALNCGGSQGSGRSDGQGNYSISIGAAGSCTITVEGKSAMVVLGKEAKRYDFEVPAGGDSLIQR